MSTRTALLNRSGFRRGPLTRPVDRIEAWSQLALVLVVLLVMFPAAWFVGDQVGRAGVQQEHLQQSRLHQLPARLLETAPDPTSGVGGLVVTTPVTARWTTPQGAVRTGIIRAAPGARTGSIQMIWTDAAGTPAPPPQGHDDTVASVFAAVFLVIVLLTSALIGIGVLVHRRFDRHRFLLWEQDWQRVGPAWSR